MILSYAPGNRPVVTTETLSSILFLILVRRSERRSSKKSGNGTHDGVKGQMPKNS